MDQIESAINKGLDDFTTKYEIGDNVIGDLREMIIDSVRKNVKLPTGSVTVSSGGKHRRKTGYNCYVAARFLEAKEAGDERNSQEKMTEFSKTWKTLTPDEKKPYEQEADKANQSLPPTSSSGSSGTGSRRKMSGYNLYYRENKNSLKAEATEEGIKIMTHVGATWRALSKDDQLVWNNRAAEIDNSE